MNQEAEGSPQSSFRRELEGQVRIVREARATVEVSGLRMHELEDLYDRLGNCAEGNNWRILFAAASQILAGAAAGAWATGDASTTTVLVLFLFAAVCGLAYFAVRDTESDSVHNIHKAFGKVLSTFVEVEVPPEEKSQP